MKFNLKERFYRLVRCEGASGWSQRRILAKLGFRRQPILKVADGFATADALFDGGKPSAATRWLIYPESVETAELPKTVEPEDAGGFAQHLVRTHAPAYVYRIPEAFYLGKHGAVLDKDRRVFSDLLDAKAEYFQPEMNKNRAFLCDGDALVLTASANHFHWLVKMLPRLHLLERAGLSLDAFETLLINRPLKAHQEAYPLLPQLSNKPMQVVRRNDFWICRNLYTCSIPHNVPRWATEGIRELFARHLVAQDGKPKAIYLTRGDSGKRCVRNEAEVRACLEKRGFVTVDFSQCSFLEQIQWMASAEVIVAPHGAALANLVFAREGTRLLEIFAHSENQKCYWMIARHNRLVYHYCMAEPVPTGSDGNAFDMRIPVPKLERALDALLADPGV
ncbi:MAG: glycosyltransferase family 61 protein [Verrucomicrobiota bacterium]